MAFDDAAAEHLASTVGAGKARLVADVVRLARERDPDKWDSILVSLADQANALATAINDGLTVDDRDSTRIIDVDAVDRRMMDDLPPAARRLLLAGPDPEDVVSVAPEFEVMPGETRSQSIIRWGLSSPEDSVRNIALALQRQDEVLGAARRSASAPPPSAASDGAQREEDVFTVVDLVTGQRMFPHDEFDLDGAERACGSLNSQPGAGGRFNILRNGERIPFDDPIWDEKDATAVPGLQAAVAATPATWAPSADASRDVPADAPGSEDASESVAAAEGMGPG